MDTGVDLGEIMEKAVQLPAQINSEAKIGVSCLNIHITIMNLYICDDV